MDEKLLWILNDAGEFGLITVSLHTYIAVLYNSLMCNWKGGGLHFDKHCIIMYAYLQLIFHAKNNEHLESGLVSAITYLPTTKKINLPRY